MLTAGSKPVGAATPQPHAKVCELIAHWRDLAPRPGQLPGRQHFDPMRVPKLLPNLWLVDVIPGVPRRFRYRLIGTRLVEAGIPGRPGEFVDQPGPHADPIAVRRLFEAIVDGREPNWSIGRPLLSHSTFVERIERVSMPMAADGQTVDLILSLTLFHRTDGSVR